jgi:hypothetical protein
VAADYALAKLSLAAVAELLRLENELEAARRVLETALVFAIGTGDRETELVVCDRLGFVFYQARDMASCRFYHARFAEGVTEAPGSPLGCYAACFVQNSRERVPGGVFDIDFLCSLYSPVIGERPLPDLSTVIAALLARKEFQKVELHFSERQIRVRSQAKTGRPRMLK